MHYFYVFTSSIWRFPISSYPCQHMVCPFIIAILLHMKWYLIVNLICVSLVINDVKYLICAAYIYIFFGEMSILILFFLIGLLVLIFLCFKCYLYVLDTNHLSNIWFPKIISHSVDCLSLSWWYLWSTEVFNSKSNLYFFFGYLYLCQNASPNPRLYKIYTYVFF